MDDLRTDALVREHYESHALAPQRLDALLRLRGDASGSRRNRPGLPRVLAAAACAVLAAGALIVALRRDDVPQGPEVVLPIVARPSPGADMPRIVAVQFHADWCKPSRVISPRVDDLRQRYGDEGVLFVEVDLTTGRTRRQAGYLMAALGLEDVWKRQNGRTGELLLIERTENRVLSTFGQEDELSTMAAVLGRALDPS